MPLQRLRTDELANAWVGDSNTPFQLGLLGVFDAGRWQHADGTVDLAGLASELSARAWHVPEMRRRVLWTRLGEGRPVWVVDPRFDPGRHVGTTVLAPGRDLATWAANECVRSRLELDRPLWRAEVVGGLPAGRFAVLVVVHHIMADGLEGVRIAGSLFDPSPEADAVGPPTVVRQDLPCHRDLVYDRLTRSPGARRPREPARPAHPPRRHPVADLRAAMAGLRAPLPVTSLPRHVGPDRRMAVSTVGLDSVRTAGHELGVTVNDLVLAVVAEGLRDLLSARGERLTDLALRTVVPVAGGTGQAMGMMVVDLPVGEPDPLLRLALVNRVTTTRKARSGASGGDVADILHLPLPVLRGFVRWGRRLGSSRLNLSVSNVRGPTTHLWLAGARMVEAVPVAPLVPLVPLSVAALSYAGSLAVSVNADSSVEDVELVGRGMTRAFDRYAELAGRGAELPSQ